MKITAINSIKYQGEYKAPGETFEAKKAIADDLIRQGAAKIAAVDTSAADAAKAAEKEAAALIDKIKAAKDHAELAELIADNETRPAILEAGEARWKELSETGDEE